MFGIIMQYNNTVQEIILYIIAKFIKQRQNLNKNNIFITTFTLL